MNKNIPLDELIENLKLIFGISIGVFLFILFFQPFGFIEQDVNTRLLFNAGLAGIIFVLMLILRILLPGFVPTISQFEKWNFISEILYASIWILISVAFVFYIRYVGHIRMTIFLVFKISLVCLAPSVILRANDELNSLKNMLHALLKKNKDLSMHISNTDILGNPFEIFTSENKSEIVKLQVDNLIMIKSADNYVEIFYKENEKIQQKLIRNTLKNIDNQLKKYSEFIRCHRSCIINKKYVHDFSHNYTGYRLKLSGYNEDVPVSRQYLNSVKEAITTS